MAVSLLEEPHCRFEKSTIISNSEYLPSVSKSTELAVTHDLKESNECKHFTIRGYVAEVRKRDANNCFPFSLNNYASIEPANVFPPLPVPKFRRWGCKNCVYEIIATTGQMDVKGGMNLIHNKDVKSNNNLLLGKNEETSQLDARKSLSRLPETLSENDLKEISVVKDCSVNISKVGKEGNERLRGDLVKEGVQKYKDGQDSQFQGQVAIGVNCLAYGYNAVNKKRRGKYRISGGRKKFGVAYVKDALNQALVKHKRSKLQKVGYSKMLDREATSIRMNFRLCCSKEGRGPERKREEKITSNNVRQDHTTIDMVVEKDDVQDTDPAYSSLGAHCHDRRACGVSIDNSKYIGLTDCEHQIENEDENINMKKVRKVRLLEDIIRSEKQHPAGDRPVLDDAAKDIIQHGFMSSQATSKEKVLLSNHKSQDALLSNLFKIQNSLGEEDKVQGGAVSHMDERINCALPRNQLKSVKRKKIHENHSEDAGPFSIRWFNNMPKNANAYQGEANTKEISSNFFLSDFSTDITGRKDQNLDVRDIKTSSKQKSTFNGQETSSIVIRQEMKSKNFSSQDISRSKSLSTEKMRGTSDGIGKKEPCRNQIMKCQVKDSSTLNKASLKEWGKVSKKPRSNRITDQESTDDIPMDIVELLARNQQERFHLKAGTDATTNIKCSFDLDSSQINRNNSAHVDQGPLPCQNFQVEDKVFDIWTTFPCNSEMEYEPNDCGCSINGIKEFQLDLNHHSDSPTGGSQFRKDINMDCHHLNFSCCQRNNMHSLQSRLEDQTIGCERLSRSPYHNVLQLRNGASFEGTSHFLNNSNASFLGSNLEIFSQSSDSEKPRSLVRNHPYWCSSSAAPNGLSCIDLTHGCHPNFGPTDLQSNETISALNLLRLMDQAAWSGEPQPHFRSYFGPIKENEACLECGNRENMTCICPLEARQQPRNSCLLFRPLPRIGSLGPSLQKQIFSYSSCSSIPTSNSHGFLKTDVKEKIKASHLNPNTIMCNSHNSFFRCRSSERIFPERNPDNRCYSKVDTPLPLGSFCNMDICVVNRNPAEFTVIDEHNEYMIEIKELKLKSLPPSLRAPLHGQKKQRIMKLNDLKAFAM